jgi:uncharacterized protein (DUF697 family)
LEILKRDHLLGLYDRLTGLIEKLPGGIQKPVLRELVPIRELFLESRSARILLLGPEGLSVPELLLAFTNGTPVHAGESDNGWRTYEIPERGHLQILDARSDVPQAHVETALTRFAPDAILLLTAPAKASGIGNVEGPDHASARAALCERDIPLFGLGPLSEKARLQAVISADREFSTRKTSVFSFGDMEEFSEALCSALPNPAKLEFARLTGARRAQAHIAGSLLKSFTAVCGVVALQPIPLADMPILTALQTLMVGLIIQTTGRKAGPRLIGEFVGALGVNIGAGFLFREGARAIVKVVPFWGNAVSGFVAGAGTYAIGRAAIAYFIEDIPITETKKLFKRLLPDKPSLSSGSDGPKPPALPE